MRKSNWFRRHEKGIAAAFFAAVLTVTGAAAYNIQDSYGYTYSYDKDGVTFVQVNPGTSHISKDTGEAYAVDDSWEYDVTDGQGRYGTAEYSYVSQEAQDASSAVEEGNYMYAGDSDLYEAIGLEWNNKKNCWTYKSRPVRIIWEEDGCFTSWGNTDKEDCTYIFVSKKYGEGSVTYQLEELTLQELQELYSKEHPGSWIE